MRIVQALHWLKDRLPIEGEAIQRRLGRILTDPAYGRAIEDDPRQGFGNLPVWMQASRPYGFSYHFGFHRPTWS